MPIRTEPSLSPGLRTHSCSAVYFRSSGYIAAGYPTRRHGAPGSRLGAAAGLRVLRTVVGVDRGDVDALELLGPHRGAVALELRLGALGERQAPGQRVWLPDDVDD